MINKNIARERSRRLVVHASVKSRKAKPQRAKRLHTDVRRAQIVSEATNLFAEIGFAANTRDLANRMGTTQPLLYRYFSSKELLIQAVLTSVLEKQSSFDWISVVTDRSKPLKERLVFFSTEYSAKTYDRTWVRLYMFAGLAGGELNRRYISTVTEPILRAIAAEIKFELGITAGRTRSITQTELDYLWLFHGGLYYYAIRRYIYGLHVNDETHSLVIASGVDNLIDGLARLYQGRT